jgi:hypothetical protein
MNQETGLTFTLFSVVTIDGGSLCQQSGKSGGNVIKRTSTCSLSLDKSSDVRLDIPAPTPRCAETARDGNKSVAAEWREAGNNYQFHNSPHKVVCALCLDSGFGLVLTS